MESSFFGTKFMFMHLGFEKFSVEGDVQCIVCWIYKIKKYNCSSKKPVLFAWIEENYG
jgi:hypothetical protein